MGVLEDVLLGGEPGPDNFYKWGVVTGIGPLRVLLDGESSALAITPESLVAGLLTGDRVWCQINRRQLIILGRAANAARSATSEIRRVGSAQKVTNGTNSTSDVNICSVVIPPALCVAGYKFTMRGKTDIVPDTAGSYSDLQIKVGGVANGNGGTQIAAGYVDHRIAGRIVAVSTVGEWTCNLTPGADGLWVNLVLAPANGAYVSAATSRPATLTVDWIVS